MDIDLLVLFDNIVADVASRREFPSLGTVFEDQGSRSKLVKLAKSE